jgi:hypothetical protein
MPSSRSWFALGLAAIVGVVCFSLGWPGLTGVDSAHAQQSGPEGHFVVSSSGESSVLLDTRTGKSWKLVPSADKASPSVWLPIERLETPNEVAKWRVEETQRAKRVLENRNKSREASQIRDMIENLERQLRRARDSAAPNVDDTANELERKIAELKAKLAEHEK